MYLLLILAACCLSPQWTAAAADGKPTLHVLGSSTAAAFPPERYPLTGWAQVLGEHFDPEKIIVEDNAKSGRSSKSFYDEGAWTPIRDALKPGDYVLIEFGHNDSKIEDPKRYTDPGTTFTDYLKRYIEETRANNAVPILSTSINRNHWRSDTQLEDTLGGYPTAVRKLAAEMDVPVLDMDVLTRELFERLGKAATTRLFMNLEKGAFPNYPDGRTDNTHLQEAGARAVCDAAVKGIAALPLPLKQFLVTFRQ